MSVILKGCEIEMPHSCDICPFCGCDYTCMNYTADCYGEDIGDYSMCRHEKCNLVEIPEGARLIDGNQLIFNLASLVLGGIEALSDLHNPQNTKNNWRSGMHTAWREIDDAPTIFEEE